MIERDLDMEEGVMGDEVLTKAELQVKYLRQTKLGGQSSSAAASMFVEPRPTEETRLTSQSGSSFATKSPFYYTGSFEEPEEETKSFGGMLDGGNSN